MFERFSSSGLAGAYVDHLKDQGIESKFIFQPRTPHDRTPFLVVGTGEHGALLNMAVGPVDKRNLKCHSISGTSPD